MAEIPLGKQSPPAEHYAPELLFPIARDAGRSELKLGPELPFMGQDVWHAWEMSWLGEDGTPEVAVGRFAFDASAPNIVESKSFKLYLNSLYQSHFASRKELLVTLADDLEQATGARPQVDLFKLDAQALQPCALPGRCIDAAGDGHLPAFPDKRLLRAVKGEGGAWHSHLLRSLCPVTAQPDWGSVVIECGGVNLDEAGLLAYLLGFRQNQEFHEQCVERIFCDLMEALSPTELSVQASYMRRGGLDISPWRSNHRATAPLRRTSRQ